MIELTCTVLRSVSAGCNAIVVFLDMAKQSGAHTITGTIDNLCFYQMEGKYYVRLKSSLTGKRVKKDPAFSNTMHYANLLAGASVIASSLYRQLNEQQKVKGLFRKITGEAMQLLKAGTPEAQVVKQLEHAYLKPVRLRRPAIAQVLKQRLFAEAVFQNHFTERLPGNYNTVILSCCYAPP
jgi:hypothetical protein